MSDVTARVESVQKTLVRLRSELSATEWMTGQVLTLVGELAAIVQETCAANADVPVRKQQATYDRREALNRLLYQACRSLPPGIEGERRDTEVMRILRAWNVTSAELAQLGYESGAMCARS